MEPTGKRPRPHKSHPPETERAEQLAWNLLKTRSGEVAFLFAPDQVYVAWHDHSRIATSAVVKLIQGVWQCDPAHARSLLRRRIFSTGAPTEMCFGMVKIAAKRLTPLLVPRDHGLPAEVRITEVKKVAPTFSEGRGHLFHPMRTAFEMAGQIRDREVSGPLHAADRPVAALLVSAEGELLHWAVNTNARNRTLHAEVNLIQGYCSPDRPHLPPGCRIYVTLKSCKMCAGMIWTMMKDIRTCRVYYGQDDPGPGARSTVLDIGSHERARATADPHLLALELEWILTPELEATGQY